MLKRNSVVRDICAHRTNRSLTVSITVAGILQKAGFISYSRGNMKILDPEGSVNGACECYEIVNAQFDKIFDRPRRELMLENKD